MTDPSIPLLWTEIQAVGTDDELDAVAAAFALVACVDGNLADEEASRWRELVPGQGKGERVRALFDELCGHLLDDFAHGRAQAFDKLKGVYGDHDGAARVLRIAQMAVVADSEIGEAEEAILKEIAEAIGAHPAEGV